MGGGSPESVGPSCESEIECVNKPFLRNSCSKRPAKFLSLLKLLMLALVALTLSPLEVSAYETFGADDPGHCDYEAKAMDYML